MAKQYIYIMQSAKETNTCKIGSTKNLINRLKTYNTTTGKSDENKSEYLFTCEVKDMKILEKDIKNEFKILREKENKEMYLCNDHLFKNYVEFIKSHKLFVKELFIKIDDKKQIVKIVKRTAPSLKERGLSHINLLNKAKKVKNDEFYTRYEDIEKELSMYDKKNWKNKTVFCNCDDAVGNNKDERDTSAFSLYFLQNFKKLELKKLICTHFSGPVDLFNQGPKGYVFTKTGYRELKDYPPGYTGSFDDPLSIKILNEEADIVCTNPPFSRSRDYWDVIIKSGKKFLIISNTTNALHTVYISYFKNNKVWPGHNEVYWFLTPKKELTRAAGYWYTNQTKKNRPKYKNLKFMPLKDIPTKYKKYDDSKILLVDKSYIPNDYKKPFGVSANPILNGLLEKGYKISQDNEYIPHVEGKMCFSRVIVQRI
jgi:sulfur relay (sulfurtransferase) DsrF/TusC family protein